VECHRWLVSFAECVNNEQQDDKNDREDHGHGICACEQGLNPLPALSIGGRHEQIGSAQAKSEDANGRNDGDCFWDARFVVPGKFHCR
jgi:hypothetical protein